MLVGFQWASLSHYVMLKDRAFDLAALLRTWKKDKTSNSAFPPPKHRIAVDCETTHGFGFNLANTFGWGINHKEAFQGCDIHFDVLRCFGFCFVFCFLFFETCFLRGTYILVQKDLSTALIWTDVCCMSDKTC